MLHFELLGISAGYEAHASHKHAKHVSVHIVCTNLQAKLKLSTAEKMIFTCILV